jgi:hypothetical protein
MDDETPKNNQFLTKHIVSRTRWLWVFGSGIGTLVGAGLALSMFPGAAFGRNPIGQFGWNLVGFSLAIGIPIALSQWLILRYVLRYRETANTSFLILWIPVTSIGLVSMILPLWWWSAAEFLFFPPIVVVPMFPGMIILGLGQWLILRQLIAATFTWVVRTIIGAAIGALFGFLVVRLAFPIPLEAMWAFVIMVSIAALQWTALVRDLDADLRR